MKFIFIIYSILVLHYAIADECSSLFEQKNSTVTFSEEQFKDQPAFFYSLGRKLKKNKEETNEFIYGSFLYLGENHTPYTAKTCIDSTLTVSNPTDDRELHLTITNSPKTKIIWEPINEFDEWQSTCNALSFPGDYIINIKDQLTDTPYDVKFHINAIQRKVLFYKTYQSKITYDYKSYIIHPKNPEIKIISCSDYHFSNTALYFYNSRSFVNILNIKNSPKPHHKIDTNLCALMSVEGLYQLFNNGNPIGEIKTYNNSNYESYYDFNKPRLTYKLEFSYHIYPSFRFNDNKVVPINNCYWNGSVYSLYYFQQLKNMPVFFDNVSVLYQDSNASRQSHTLFKKQLNIEYKIDNPINQLEIENLLNNLKVPIKNKPNQLCRQLMYPGNYTLNFSDHTAMNIYNTDFIQVATTHHKIYNNLQARYVYSLKKLEDKDNNNTLKYSCIDSFNEEGYDNSVFNQIEDHSDFSSIDTLGTFKQEGPNKFITSISHAPASESWKELKVHEDESWLDNNTIKLKLRANKECLELEEGKTYNALYENTNFKLKVGKIVLSRFNRFIGYTVLFNSGKEEDLKNKTKLLLDEASFPIYKEIKSPFLSHCLSNEYSNTFYTEKFTEIKKDGFFHSHNKELRSTQLKFNTITEVSEHDIKK